MRKTLSLMLLVLLTLPAAVAQPEYSNLDTVEGLPENYFRTDWYTQCHSFASDSISFGVRAPLRKITVDGDAPWIAKEFYTAEPRQVQGMAALVVINVMGHIGSSGYADSVRMPEYLRLMQGTTCVVVNAAGDTIDELNAAGYPHNMTEMGLLRWDTVTPRVLRLPKRFGASSADDYFLCYAYEVTFPTPVSVDTVFYIMGSHNSNWYSMHMFDHYPTIYFGIRETISDNCDRCEEADHRGVFSIEKYPPVNVDHWHVDNYNQRVFGFFFPIFVDDPD